MIFSLAKLSKKRGYKWEPQVLYMVNITASTIFFVRPVAAGECKMDLMFTNHGTSENQTLQGCRQFHPQSTFALLIA
jgi:hypothetical protein